MTHPALEPDSVAVVTGGASGIGRAAAVRFAGLGLRVCIADLGAERLADAGAAIAAASPAGEDAVLTVETDVSRLDDLVRLEAAVRDRFGGADVLMNNAGIEPGTGVFGPADAWKRMLAVNLWGVDPRHPGLRAGHDRPRPARARRQHRLEAGHHHAARQSGLQRLQGRGEGLYRGAGARAAQHRRAARSARTC